ncbi:MAG: phosphoglycerate transporter [Dehalococcoidia bacterium]|nr:phosphoglycerate transporter [Dehalococcoidia bacterium]
MYKIGWFSTGRDKAARDLFRTVCGSIQKGEIKAEIAFVFSNREQGEKRESDLFFELVQSYKIPLICLSSSKFKERLGESRYNRLQFEKEAMRRLAPTCRGRPDLCVLAGYMLIVGEEMCQRYPMINLHPAAPGGPRGTWQEVIWQLIEEGASETGVMMHLVTPELDEGPPVTFCTFSLRGEPFDRYWDEIKGRSIEELKTKEGERSPLFKLIRQHGLAREFPLIVATLKAFSEGKVRIEGGRVVDGGGKAIEGYDLTGEIDEKVKGALAK